MINLESDAAREDMVGNLITLSRSSAWKYLQSHLENLRNQAQEELLSNQITVDKNLSPLEVTRREINYLSSLIGMPDNLIKSLQNKPSADIDDLDGQNPSTSPTVYPEDDSYEPSDTPARPDGGF